MLRGAGRSARQGAGGPDGLPERRRRGQRRGAHGGVRPVRRPFGFRPDFCEAADPESKGIVENLVGYAKSDRIVPQAPFGDLAAANAAAAAWCAEVNGVIHSEICAVPAERLVIERELLGPLPSLQASIGRQVTRKVDRL